MFKVVIAEDELIFREYLLSIIDWHAYGFDVIGVAKNGKEAIDVCNASMPDLVFLDINMPKIDGLKVAEQIKKKNKKVCIVLITGYGEFTYAQKAVKLGVEDYLLKPIVETDLIEALLIIKKKLLADRTDKLKTERDIDQKITSSLSRLIMGDTSVDLEITKNSFWQNVTQNTGIFAVSIEINNLQEMLLEKKDHPNAIDVVTQKIHASVPQNIKFAVFTESNNRIIVIIRTDDIHEMDFVAHEFFQIICEDLRCKHKISLAVGIGNIYHDLISVRKSYLESLDALMCKSVSSTCQVLKYLECQSRSLNFYNHEVRERLISYLRLTDFESIQLEMKCIFDDLIRKKVVAESVYSIAIGLSSLCLSYITDMGAEITDVLGSEFSLMKIVHDGMPIDLVKTATLELYQKTVNYFDCNKISKTMKIAESVKEYIDNNYYRKDLNLAALSKQFYHSPDYIRKVFKRKLHVSITDYITRVRMIKAKNLLCGGKVKISSVCQDVGYSDVSYFSKVFKKYYGLTPSDFENMCTSPIPPGISK